MAIVSISQLKSWFLALKKPTEDQFSDVFDSLVHKQRDFDQMGGGLKPHNPARPYTAGEAAICLGKIRLAKTNLQPGAYNPAQWEDYENNPVSLGIPRWLPDTEYEFDTENPEAAPQVIYQLSVLQATANSVGIEPFVDPDWNDYWEVLVTTRGGVLPIYIPGPVENRLVYEYTESAAPKGIYRANHTEEPYQNGFKSTDFATELADDKWLLVAPRSGGIGGGGIEAVVEDETPQLGGDLDTNSHDILMAEGSMLKFPTVELSDVGDGLKINKSTIIGPNNELIVSPDYLHYTSENTEFQINTLAGVSENKGFRFTVTDESGSFSLTISANGIQTPMKYLPGQEFNIPEQIVNKEYVDSLISTTVFSSNVTLPATFFETDELVILPSSTVAFTSNGLHTIQMQLCGVFSTSAITSGRTIFRFKLNGATTVEWVAYTNQSINIQMTTIPLEFAISDFESDTIEVTMALVGSDSNSQFNVDDSSFRVLVLKQ